VVGTVAPYRSSIVSSQIEGRVQSVPVREGDPVVAGETVIAAVRRTDLEIDLRIEKAGLAKAHHDYLRLKRGNRPEEIEAHRARVREKKAELKRDELELKRVEEQINIDLRIEKAGLAKARQDYLRLKRGSRSEEIEAQRARVQEKEAELKRDELELKRVEEQTNADLRIEKAGLAKALQDYLRLKRGNRPEEIQASRARVRERKAELKRDELELKRVKDLLEIDLRIEKAGLAKARQDYLRLKRGNRPEEIQALHARVREKGAELKRDELELKRAEGLFEKKILNRSTYDQAVARHQISKNRYAAEKYNLLVLEAGPRKEEVAKAKAEVNRMKARVASKNIHNRSTFDQAVAKYQISKSKHVAETLNLKILEIGPRKEEIEKAKAEMERMKARVSSKEILSRSIYAQAVAKYKTSKSKYIAEKYNLQILEAGPREEETAKAKAEVNRMKARVASKEILNRSIYDRAVAKHQISKSQYVAEKYNLRISEIGPRRELIAIARSEVDRMKARVASIEDKLKKTNIISPLTGFLTEKSLEVGQWVFKGGKVGEVIEIKKMIVRASVSEKQISYVGVGDSAKVIFDALPNQKFKGFIARIIPKADTKSRTFPIEIELQNTPKYEIKVGMFARIGLEYGSSDQVLLIPKDALLIRPKGASAFVFDKGRVREIVFRPGRTVDSFVEVPGGVIKHKMMVVVQGNEKLRGGMKVRLKGQNRRKGPQRKKNGRPTRRNTQKGRWR